MNYSKRNLSVLYSYVFAVLTSVRFADGHLPYHMAILQEAGNERCQEHLAELNKK